MKTRRRLRSELIKLLGRVDDREVQVVSAEWEWLSQAVNLGVDDGGCSVQGLTGRVTLSFDVVLYDPKLDALNDPETFKRLA